MARSKNTTVLGHNLFLRLFFFLTFALISFISTPPPDAFAKCSEPSVGSIEDTGATSDTAGRVTCCKDGSLQGWRYGAVFFTGDWANETWPTWSGSGSLDFTVRGAVYCCSGTNNNAYVKANDISFDHSITISKDSLERSCDGDKSWGPISSDYLKATVPEASLKQASCDSNNPANCTLTVEVTSTLGSGTAATYNSYVKFKWSKSKTFSLSYDANGGSNAPSATSCTTTGDSCDVTVTSSTPTRSGYNFKGWNDNSSGTSTNRNAGGTISLSANKTIYAKWAQLYNQTLQYDANGGSNAPRAQTNGPTESSSHTFTVTSSTPTPPTGKKFIGWSTSSTATSASYTSGSTISVTGTTTLYAVYEAYTVATFSAPAITITSTELTHISGDNYKAIGSKDNYSLTVYYHLTRTNNTPTSAVSQYGTRSADSHDGVYPNNTTNSNDLTYNVTQDISSPKTTPNITHGGWYNNICFYFKYDSKVYYDGTTRVGSAETSTTYRCINIYNPGQYHAAFTGWISVANGPGLSGTGENRVGNGYQSRFSYSPKYNIQRTDALNIPEKADSYVAINNVYTTFDEKYYPADNTADKRLTLALDNYEITYWPEDGWDWTYVDIGGAAQSRCYYLRYDSDVLYYDNERQYGNYAGRAHTCVSITNPPNTETISFTGTPVSATMTANNRLTRTDSNRVGTVINHDRNTSGTLCGSSSASVDSKIGKWCDNATARTATYTADFSHQITRNDNSSTILGKTMNASVS